MRRAISWIAVSSRPQAEKESPDEQRRENEAAARKIGAEIVAVLDVPGQSREYTEFVDAETNILAYRQLREMVKAGAADILIARDLSRLGRRTALASQVIDICHANGCAIYLRSSPPQSLDANEQAMSIGGQITYGIEGLFLQMELINLRKRHAFGMEARIKAGKMPGRPPFGYRKKGDGDYVIHAQEAQTVKRIVELYLYEGLSLRKIATELGIGISTAEHVINTIWTYAGYAQYRLKSKKHDPMRNRGVWEAIVSEDTAQEVESERARRSEARRSVSSPALYSGILRCQQCGGRLASNGRKHIHNAGYGRTDRIYVCSNRRNQAERCTKTLIGESAVTFALLLYIGEIRRRETYDSMIESLRQDTAPIEKEIAELETALQDLTQQRDRLTRAYTDGILDLEEFQAHMTRIRNQQRNAELQLIARRNQATHADVANRVERLQEFVAVTVDMLTGDDYDIVKVNAFLKRHATIWVEGGNVTQIVTR